MADNYDTIIRYVENEMSVQERQEFEQQLSENTTLSEQVHLLSELNKTVSTRLQNASREDKLREDLTQIGKDFFRSPAVPVATSATKPSAVRPLRLWFSIAAAMALLLVSWLLWHQLAPRDLYAQYREFPQASFTTRSSQSPSPQDLAAIASDFNAGKYADALTQLDAYLAQRPNFTEGRFYRALCHLELGHSQTAIDQLGELAKGKSAFAEDAAWFLALAYLQQKNYAACRQTLLMFEPGSTYHAKAEQLTTDIQGR